MITHTQFFKDLKAGQIARVYYFYGVEDYVKRMALERLREALLPAGLEALNENVLEEASFAQIKAAAETLPMLCERRLVIVPDWAPLKPGKAREEADEAERLAEFLPKFPESCCVVFWMRTAPDGRKKAVQALMKQAVAVSFEYLSDADLFKWAAGRLRQREVQIDRPAVELLALLAGRGLTRLDLELDKLASYAKERRQITVEDVEALVSPSLESTVFQLIDALFAGNMARTQTLLKTTLEGGENPIGILAMLTRQMRLLTHTRILTDGGLSLAQVEKQLELSRYAMERTARQARQFSREMLQDAYRACVDADYAIKSGRMRDQAALDQTIMRLDQMIRQKK